MSGLRRDWAIDLLTMGRNRPGTRFAAARPDGLVIHATATPGATAKQLRDYWEANPNVQASAHVAVDWTEVRVLIPLLAGAEIAWHAGPTANARFVGVEMCEPVSEPAQFLAMYRNALQTFAVILDHYGWPADDAHVWSHKRVSDTWRETDHQDPIAFLARFDRTWDELMAELRRAAAPAG